MSQLLFKNARVFDGIRDERTLMPWLIDAHVHLYASDVSVQKIEAALRSAK